MHAWLFKNAFVLESHYACVCPPLRLLITSGIIQAPYDWLNKFWRVSLVGVALALINIVESSLIGVS